MKAKYLVLGLLLFSSMTLAGLVQPFSVLVTLNPDGSGSADGDMVSARFSDNDVEFIGCGIRAFDDGAGGVFHFGFCQAADSSDVRGFCNTDRADLLDAIKSTADYSFITFSWNAAGECTRIGFSTQSFYIPEHLDKNKKKK